MGFTRSLYESAIGVINVNLSDEESAVAGTEPAGPAIGQLTAYASGSRRRNGVHTRGAILTRTITDGTDSASVSRFLTLRSASDLDSASYSPGTEIAIDGVTWKVSKLKKEVIV